MIGQVLGGTYRLVERLGGGRFTDAHLGRDLRTNTLVAVKILHARIARDPTVAARFGHTGPQLAQIRLPGIAQTLDARWEPPSPPFIVMEHVQGMPADAWLQRYGRLPIPDAVSIVEQVLIALGPAHEGGMVHGDIKPRSLILESDGRLMVLGFGTDRLIGIEAVAATYSPFAVTEYLAPEQYRGQPVDFRADLYAVGAVLYELLTGRPPFVRDPRGGTPDLVTRILRVPPVPLAQLRPEVPPALAAIVDRALAKDPNQRFQSTYEMWQRLTAAGSFDAPSGRPYRPASGSPGTSYPPQYGPSGPGSPAPGRSDGAWAEAWPPGHEQPLPRLAASQGNRQTPTEEPTAADPNRQGSLVWQIVGLGSAIVVLAFLAFAFRDVILPDDAAPTPTPQVARATVTPTTAAAAAAGLATASPGAASPPAAAGSSPAPGQAALAPSAPAAPGPAVSSPAATPPAGATVDPGNQPAAPAQPPRPPSTPAPPGVLLADNFDNPDESQLQRGSPHPADYLFGFEGGEYIVRKINAALAAAPTVFLPGAYDNSVISVDVRITGDAAARYAYVVCRDRSSDNQTTQYRASLMPDTRRLILSRWSNGRQRVLAEAREEATIRAGNAGNRIELRCDGTKITATVNGTVTVTAADAMLNRGEHGLGVGTIAGVTGTVEARFDNLDVRVPPPTPP